MKNFFRICLMVSLITISFTSCRNDKKKVDGVEMDKDADVKVKDNGKKLKVEDDDKKVKIKKDESGNIEKKKVKKKDEE